MTARLTATAVEDLAAELVARLDGPHDDNQTAAAAELAAEAVRLLCYATRPLRPDGLSSPVTAWRVAGSLGYTARGLDQLAGQVSRWLIAELDAGRLRHDQDNDLAAAVAQIRRDLADVRYHAAELAAAVDRAGAGLCHLSPVPGGVS